MSWLQIKFRFRALFAKRKLDAEMNEEMRSRIEMQTQENIAKALDRSVNGNAAWTISTGWNMGRLFSEPGICAARQNVAIAVDLRLLFEEIEGAARLREAGDLGARRLIRLEHQHGQPGVRRQRDAGRQFQDAVLLHHFDCLHAATLDHRRPIAKVQPALMHKPI